MGAPKGNKNGRQFQKGQSGNPKGRPKGHVAPTTAIRKYLEEHPECVDEIVRVGIDKMKKGDFQYYKYLIDRLDGTPAQSMLLNTNVTHHIKVYEDGQSTQ